MVTIPVLPGVVKLLPQKSKVEKKKVDCVHCGEKVIEDFMKYHLSSASCKWKREQKDKSIKSRESSANSSLSEETFFDGLANMFKEDKSREGKKDLKSSDVYNAFKKLDGGWFCLACDRKLRVDESLVSHVHTEKLAKKDASGAVKVTPFKV